MFDASLFDMYFANVFCICHEKDINHYQKLATHLQSTGDNKIIFTFNSNQSIKAGENVNSFISNEIENANFVIYFASAESQADHNSLFYLQSKQTTCKYITIVTRPVLLIDFLKNTIVFNDVPLNKNEDEDKIWTELVNELKYWIYYDNALFKLNANDYKGAIPLFHEAKQLLTYTSFVRIQEISDYIEYSKKSFFENETRNQIYTELNNKFEQKYLPRENLTNQLSKRSEQLNLSNNKLEYFKKIVLGTSIGALLFIITTISYCNKANKTEVKIDDNTQFILPPVKVRNFYLRNEKHSGDKIATHINDDLIYENVEYLCPTILMSSNTKKTFKGVFYWRLIHKGETVKYKKSPKGFTMKNEITVSTNEKSHIISCLGSDEPSFEKGNYQSELWLNYNGKLQLIAADYFKIK